jgi:hypothetical protein
VGPPPGGGGGGGGGGRQGRRDRWRAANVDDVGHH